MKHAWVLLLAGSCIRSQSIDCANADTTWLCPSSYVCDVAHAACVLPEQLETCRGQADGADCTIQGSTPGICSAEVCITPHCGDGFVRGLEACDGHDLGARPDCTDHGFYDAKPVQCTPDCKYDTSACTSFCGDGIINGAELCDGASPQLSCVDLGYGAGALGCQQCGPGLADCKFLDWHVFNAPRFVAGVHGTVDNNVFAVGWFDQVFRFDGQGWTDLGAACKSQSVDTFYDAVLALGDGEAVAIGYERQGPNPGVLVHVTPNGCTRQLMGTTEQQAVWASSASDVYAVGYGIHHWDGSAWATVDTGFSYWRIWGSGPNDIYIGGSGGLLHGSGVTWTPVTMPIVNVSAIWGMSSTDVYVAGTNAAAQAKLAHFDGAQWVLLADPPLGDGTGTAGTRTMMAGYYGVHELHGTSWASLGVPASTSVASMWQSPTGRVVAAANNAIYTYSGGVESAATVAGTTGTSVRARGPDDAYAITYTNFSVWNGTSWITDQDPSTPGGLVDVWPDPMGDVYAIQAYSNGGLYHRSSAGVWTLLAGSLDNAVRVWGSALNDIWIATNSGLEHWDGIGPGTTLCATCATRMWALSGTSASDVFAVGDSGSILHWNGAAWTAMTSNATGFLDDVFAVSASDVHVVGYNGVYLHYNGVAWTPSIVPPGSDLYGVWATSDHDVFVIGGNGMSHFDGARWSPVRTLGFGYAAGITGKGDVLYTIDNRALVTRLIRTIPW